jgi:ferredoxin
LFYSVTIHFIDQKGEKIDVQAPIGENILIVAHENNIDLEGACECSLACSTCHVYIDEEHYNMLPEPVEEEEDMLDLAYGLTPLSRLGCQVIVTKELEGMTVTLPKATRNMMVDKKYRNLFFPRNLVVSKFYKKK